MGGKDGWKDGRNTTWGYTLHNLLQQHQHTDYNMVCGDDAGFRNRHILFFYFVVFGLNFSFFLLSLAVLRLSRFCLAGTEAMEWNTRYRRDQHGIRRSILSCVKVLSKSYS